jgi:hypothetical protein
MYVQIYFKGAGLPVWTPAEISLTEIFDRRGFLKQQTYLLLHIQWAFSFEVHCGMAKYVSSTFNIIVPPIL